MARTLTLSPGGSIPTLSPGDALVLDGAGYANLRFENLKGEPEAPITVRAAHLHSAKVTGGEFGVHIEGCRHTLFDGLDVTAKGHGLKASDSRFLTFRNQLWHGCGVEGAIFGAVDDLLVEDCESFGNGKGYGEYPPEKGHGLYVSWGSKRPTIRRFYGHDSGGCGIQLNGSPDISGIIESPTIEDCVLTHNGHGGAAGMNIMRTRGGMIKNVLLAWWNWSSGQDEAGGIACYSDGSDFAVEGLLFDRVTIYFPPGRGRYGMQFLDGAKNNRVARSLIYCGRGPYFQGTGFSLSEPNRYGLSNAASETIQDPQHGDFTSRFPICGFRDWRQEPSPPPPHPDPLTAVRAALAELDEPLSALWHSISNVKRATLKAKMKQEHAALVSGVAKAKTAAGC